MGRFFFVLIAALLAAACESPASLGATCDRNAQCADPLVCRLGRCRAECIENRDCPLGAECLADQTGLRACSLPADRGCGSGGTTCQTPLTCVNDHCVNTCTVMRDCPDDGVCMPIADASISFCFAPDRGQDAGATQDAGTRSDAGAPCVDGSCARSLCVGDRFACAIHEDTHNVGCWGINGFGQLGDGMTPTVPRHHDLDGGVDAGEDFSATAVTVIDDDGQALVATALACTEQAACALVAGGAISCWGGEGGAGNVLSGDPAVTEPSRAHASTLGAGFTTLAGGRYHYCATRAGVDDSVVCWGDSADGELGDGLHPGDRIDTMLGSVWGSAQLALGDGLTCGLRDGAITCSGGDDGGSLGPDATAFPASEGTPVPVPLDARATAVVAGAGFECALLESQTVTCWGWAAQGSLGIAVELGGPLDDCTVSGAASPCHRTPTLVDLGATPIARIWSGGFIPFACAQDTTGLTSCWGQLPSGDCGLIPAPERCGTPVRVPLFDHVTEIAMGPLSTCARALDGSITCVGTNELGALGRGTTDPSAMPRFDSVPVIGF